MREENHVYYLQPEKRCLENSLALLCQVANKNNFWRIWGCEKVGAQISHC